MTDIAGLLDSLSLAPSLPGALCAGRHELFDASIEASRTGTAAAAELAQARAEALRICGGCPVLQPCRRWFDSLPKSKRPQGVCAGQLNARTQRRQDKAS